MSKRFRTGDKNAAGGRPFNPQTKTYKCVTADTWFSDNDGGNVCGSHIIFHIGNYNAPLGLVAEKAWTKAVGLAAYRHPSGHLEVVADKYTAYLVRSVLYDVRIQYTGATAYDLDWVFAYKFSDEADETEPAFPITVAATEVWLDMQASPGWVWFRQSCNHDKLKDGCVLETKISVDDVPKLTIAMNNADSSVAFTIDDLKGPVGDTAIAPTIDTRLHMVAFKLDRDGIPGVTIDKDFWLNIRCTQTVSLYKNINTTDMIDEGDNV